MAISCDAVGGCDEVEIRAGDGGTTVLLRMSLPARGAGRQR